MQIIKDKVIIDNHWTYLTDDTAVTDGDVSVSVSRLQNEGEKLLNRNGRLGVRIEPSDSVESILAFLPNLALVELYFPDLADGRLFSHAWLLRNRYDYTGELRAVGNFLPDQVFYLSRVGVNAFCPDREEDLTVTLMSLNDFSVKYQESVC
jgi:uncharacterized protein (DUF934 family)